MAQELDHRRIAFLTGQRHRGIARQKLLQTEHQERHQKERRNGERQALEDETDHRAFQRSGA